MKGKSLPAITVFTKALQYMREIVVRDLNKRVEYPNRRILWILTVPAIWSHAARQVMRIAATQVHLYCNHTYLHYSSDVHLSSYNKGH